MKKIISGISIACLFIGFANHSAAQEAMPSLLLSGDPVSLAHAGGSIALDANAYAVQNNTAAMSFYEGIMDAAISYGMWQPTAANDKIINVAAFGRIGKRWAIGVDAKFVLMPKINIVDSDGIQEQLNSTFSPSEYNFTLGASCRIVDWVAVGFNLKAGTSSLANNAKAACFAADIYAAFMTKFGLTAGLGVCNLGTKVNYGGAVKYALPAYLRAGAAYNILGFSADVELDYIFSGAFMSAVSVGYWYKEYVGVNIGYHYGSDKVNSGAGQMQVNHLCIPSYLSLGIGGQIKGVHVDFAYLLGSNAVKNSLCVSLGYRF